MTHIAAPVTARLDQPRRDAEERDDAADGQQARHEQDPHLRAQRLHERERPAQHDQRRRQPESCRPTPAGCGRKTWAASTSTSQCRTAEAHSR